MFDCQALTFGEAEFPLFDFTGDIPLIPEDATLLIELVLTLLGVGVVDLRVGVEGFPGGGDGLRKGLTRRKLGFGLE